MGTGRGAARRAGVHASLGTRRDADVGWCAPTSVQTSSSTLFSALVVTGLDGHGHDWPWSATLVDLKFPRQLGTAASMLHYGHAV